jgi:predicted small lipoprotein YifL
VVGRSSVRALCVPIAALLLALAMTGCGRKGGLDPPPASVADPGLASVPAPEIGPDGRPLPPSHGPNRTSPLDFLID